MTGADADTERPRLRTDYVICGAGLIAGVIASYVFLAITPKLLAHHSLFLEAFAGKNAAIVTGGALARVGRQSLLLVVLAPLLPVLLYDVFVWWGGRLWGNWLLGFYTQNSPRSARWMTRAEALVRRRGIWVLMVAYYLPIPNVLLYVSCGLSGMPLWAFILGDMIGTLLWEALLVTLGWVSGQHAVHVVNLINHYSNYVLIGIVVVIVAMSVVRTRRQLREPEVSEEPEDPESPDLHSGETSSSRHFG
jgi:membrane protein DedA with SNARE-associated domain